MGSETNEFIHNIHRALNKDDPYLRGISPKGWIKTCKELKRASKVLKGTRFGEVCKRFRKHLKGDTSNLEGIVDQLLTAIQVEGDWSRGYNDKQDRKQRSYKKKPVAELNKRWTRLEVLKANLVFDTHMAFEQRMINVGAGIQMKYKEYEQGIAEHGKWLFRYYQGYVEIGRLTSFDRWANSVDYTCVLPKDESEFNALFRVLVAMEEIGYFKRGHCTHLNISEMVMIKAGKHTNELDSELYMNSHNHGSSMAVSRNLTRK